MTPSSSRWDEATREAAPLLSERSCVVITGERNEDAARAALALAKSHVAKRRVTIVDAAGELTPLQRMLPRDAGPHGVIDHFVHGVSLRKIAHAVNRDHSLFIIPSGVGPFDYETLLRRERWRRLTMAFRSEGALLCIILPPDAAGLTAFVEDTDGVLLVGDVAYPEPRHVLARIGASRESRPAVPPAATRPDATRQARWRHVPVLASATAAVAIAAALWAVARGDDDPSGAAPAIAAEAPTRANASGTISGRLADSSLASEYSIDVVMLNSLAEAGRQLSDRLGALPAATFSPVMLGADSARWYRLLVGAWQEQKQADSALLALRNQRVLQLGFGSVRRTPFAVRVGGEQSPGEAMSRAMALRADGFPAYVLHRDADHARVYAGAFETPSQAVPLLDMFKRAGIEASIDYRIGRGI